MELELQLELQLELEFYSMKSPLTKRKTLYFFVITTTNKFNEFVIGPLIFAHFLDGIIKVMKIFELGVELR